MCTRRPAAAILSSLLAASSISGAPAEAFGQTIARSAAPSGPVSAAAAGMASASAGPGSLLQGPQGFWGLSGSISPLALPDAAIGRTPSVSAKALPGPAAVVLAAVGARIAPAAALASRRAVSSAAGRSPKVLAAARRFERGIRKPPAGKDSLLSVFFDGWSGGRSGSASAAAVSGRRTVSRPGLNRAAPPATSSVEERAYGRTATGLSPPLTGRLDVGSYRTPWDIRFKRALYLGAHYSLLGASWALLLAGVGLVPAAAAAAGLALKELWASVTRPSNGVRPEAGAALGPAELRELRSLLLRLNSGETLSAEEMDIVERSSPLLEEFLGWNEDAVEELVARMGADPYRTPRVWFDESSENLDFAGSIGRGLDKSGNVYVGLGFLFRPAEQVFGVLAHELAHLLFKDRGWLRDRVRMNGSGTNSLGYGTARAFGTAGAALVISALLQAGALLADPASLVLQAVWAGASLACAGAGLLFGLAATRQEELRADAFSGWLTRPEWLAAYLRDQAGRSLGEGGGLEILLETHPSFEDRIARLEALDVTGAGPAPALPAPRSEHALNGSAEIQVRGVDAGLAGALADGLDPSFAAEVFPLGPNGAEAVIRLHPTDAAYPFGGFEDRAREAVDSVLRARYPEAVAGPAEARGHGVFAWAAKSPTAARLVRVLEEHPIPIRFDPALGPDGPRGALETRRDGGPEIVVNPFVFEKASPRALLALLAHELLHYEVYLEMRRIGIDWLELGGLEFERLAHSIGARVWKELSADPSDDFAGEFSPPGYESGFRRWARMGRDEHIGFLKTHGYGRFTRLSELRALDPSAIAAMAGSEDSPELIARKLDALWDLYIRKSRREKAWALRHWAHVLYARLRGALGPASSGPIE